MDGHLLQHIVEKQCNLMVRVYEGDDSGEGGDDHECERVRDTSENVRTRR